MIGLIAGLVVLVLVAATTVVLIDDGDPLPSVAPTTAPESSPPAPASTAEIDAALPQLQAFVEEARGLEFTEPVDVEVLVPADYEERTRSEFREEIEEDREDLDLAAAQYQALGLLEADIDIVDILERYLTTGTAGVYRPDTKELVVRGAELTADVRVTLVHELTHALDDQVFGLDRPELDDREDESGFTFAALVEGNATLVEEQYVASLSSEERREYVEQAAAAAGGVDVTAIPPILFIEQEFLYGYGFAFAQALEAAGGNDRIDAAFEDPPLTSEAVLEPDSYLADEGRARVPAPDAEGDVVDEGIAGQFLLELLVNGQLGQDGVPEWVGDRYVVWEDGDQTCVRIAYVGDLEAIEDALDDWVDRTDGSVERSADVVTLTGCTS